MTERRSRWEERYGSSKFSYGAWQAKEYHAIVNWTTTGAVTYFFPIEGGEADRVVGVRSLNLSANLYHRSGSGLGVVHVALVKSLSANQPSSQPVAPDLLRAVGYTVYRYRQLHVVPQTAIPLFTRVKAISLKTGESLSMVVRATQLDSTTSSSPLSMVFGGTYAISEAQHGGG